ncbi:class I SAM-dependent methyltransferase family protein [Candidatus Woesearchaeota archaeon]|nr:class I SAM-dependent methyltransferase family protein [Candidatus Woesearchaeota archaeon]
MLCIKVPLKQAEKIKKELIRNGLLDKEHMIARDSQFIYFPIKKKFPTEHKIVFKMVGKRKLQSDLKKVLESKLKPEELELLKRSMDVIGSIAIIEIPTLLEKKEKLIAEEVLKNNRNIKTVLKKGRHEGVFRTQKLEYLAGEKTKEAVCKENNVVIKLDVEKVYFSQRLSHERGRIASLVKKPEEVIVMFSGCGPYTCAIAKNTPAKYVTGVEINPEGHRYELQNILLNKLSSKAKACLGDVKDIMPKLEKKYDRIIMPLPKSAADYLDVALKYANKNAIIHFYDFQKEGDFEKSIEKIKKACKTAKRKCKILGIVKCGQSSPREFRICVDFEVI